MNLKRSDALVIITVTAVCLLLGLVFLKQQTRIETTSSRLVCVRNLKQIGLSFRLWLGDGDLYPMKVNERIGGAQESAEAGQGWKIFQVMSNFIDDPKKVVCPADNRKPVDSWNQLSTNEQVSYFVGLDAEYARPNMLLSGDRNLALEGKWLSGVVSLGTNLLVQWTREQIHRGGGNVGSADGSVQAPTTKLLHWQLINSGDPTNRLVFPQ